MCINIDQLDKLINKDIDQLGKLINKGLVKYYLTTIFALGAKGSCNGLQARVIS